MALSNHQRVGKALDLLRDGLAEFGQRELQSKYGKRALAEARGLLGTERLRGDKLLSALSAPQSEAVRRMKVELRRLVFDEQVRGEKRKAGGSLIEVVASGAVKPWREAVTPHADVASGRYQQAEFAADLWQVHLGQGGDEYRDPQEFFRRTFLTESLQRLLVDGVQRLSGSGGDPVGQLQTNFGGGKTHSMLALHHLFSGLALADLPGVEEVLAVAGAKSLPQAHRVVLVGNKISPRQPAEKTRRHGGAHPLGRTGLAGHLTLRQ